jgi:hypothetical protein
MSPITRFTDACLSSAARRWPDGLGDMMAREWHAEMDFARRDPRSRPVARLWRQVAFALSLACSPAPDPGRDALVGWRGRMVGLAPGALRTVALIGIGILAGVINDLAWNTNGVIFSSFDHGIVYRTFGWWHGDPPDWVSTAANAVTMVAGIAAMVLLGRFAHRRLSPPPFRARSFGVAVRVVIPLAAGFLLRYRGIDVHLSGRPRNRSYYILIGLIEGNGAWIVLTLVVATAAIHLARRGRRIAARLTVLVGMLVTIDATGAFAGLAIVRDQHRHIMSAPIWLPYSLDVFGRPSTGGASAMAFAIVETVAVPLVYLTAFVAAFLIGRAPAVSSVARETVPIAAATGARASWASAGVRRFAMAAGGAGLVLWTYAVAVTPRTPAPLGFAWWGREYEDTELIECRIIGILLILLAILICNAGRGPVAAPTAAIGLLLAVADGLLIRAGLRGPGAAAVTLLAGGSAAIAAGWLIPRLAGPGTTDTTARRALVFTAIVAAFAIPTTIRWDMPAGREPYADMAGRALRSTAPLAAVILCAGMLLLIIAIVAALASRTERPSSRGIAAISILAFGLLFSVSVGPWLTDWLFYPDPRFFVQPVIAVILVGAARWRRSARPARTVVVWSAYAIGAAVVTVPLHAPVTQLQTFTDTLTTPSDSDVFALAPLLFGVVVALLCTKRATTVRTGPDGCGGNTGRAAVDGLT